MWSEHRHRSESDNDTVSVACRGCLASDVKLYSIQDSNLVENYVQLVGISLQDQYTQHLCSICATMLQKFDTFRERCRKAYQFLIDAEYHGKCITTYIKDIDIHTYSNQLKPPYTQTETQIQDYMSRTEEETDNVYIHEVIDSHHATMTEDSNVLIDTDDVVLFVHSDESEETINMKHDIRKDIHDTDDDDVEDNEAEFVFNEVKNEVKINTRHADLKNKLHSDEEIKESANLYGFDMKFLTEEEQYDEIVKRKTMKTKRSTQCEHCGKNCTTQNKLNKHYEQQHNKNFKHKCKICHFTFKTNHVLSKHLRMHEVIFSCKSCSMTTKYRDLLQSHYLSHKGKMHTCEYCQSTFEKRTSYLSHVRLQHSSELPWCDLCGESFVNNRGVVFHKSREHKGVINKFYCVSCGAMFTSDSALDRHIELKRCELQSCARCGEGFATEQLLRYHLIHHRDTVFACEACSVKFHNMAALERHRTDCGAAIPCVQCGGHFDDEAAMLDHVNTEHVAAIGFKCAECNKTFSNAYYYRFHLSERHRSADGKTRSSAKRPTRRSRGPDPAVRIWRPAGDDAVEKLGSRARGGAGRGAVCEICGGVFHSKAGLDIHLRTHSDLRPFKCERCSKSFRTKLVLEDHMRVHTGERPFKCEFCPKAFTIQTTLLRHRLVHTGDRRHSCQICEKRFQTSSSVKAHIKSVHMKIPARPRVRRKSKMAPIEN